MKLTRWLKNSMTDLLKKDREEPWMSFHNEKSRTIKFTNKTIYEYLVDSVEKDRDFYALNYFGTRITYNEMFKNINQIAKSLKYLGVEKGDIITICMPNTPEAVETFYAINKIGAVADMIHPLSSPKEIQDYLNSSNSCILILYDANYEKIRNYLDDTNVSKTILVSASESMPPLLRIGYILTKGLKIKKPNRFDHNFLTWFEFLNLGYLYHQRIDVKMSSKNLAVILHSGGTTGKPKGIMISNFNFNALAQQCSINVANIKPKEKIMTILPIFHGFGLGVCLHCPLTLKVEVILIPEFDARMFSKTFEKYNPNVIAGVPTLWEAMMKDDHFDNVDMSSLKYIISGGDYLSQEMEKRMNEFLKSHHASIVISKGYGMTESVAATAYTFEGANVPGSIGIPMIGNKFTICKQDTIEPLPFGEEGEICVNGPTIMMGYYGDKEETSKILKRHKDGELWLHTGDAGYINEEGIIYFTQRIKRIIVSSGFNVYPSQIEKTIENHPKVARCCVIGIPHPYKIRVAKAYVVLKEGELPTAKTKAELRLLCKRELATFSQPKEYEFVEELPKTLYNKIDYKKLEKESELEYEKRNKQNIR